MSVIPNAFRQFSLGQVLSVTQPFLLCEVTELYEILSFLTGENLTTVALPRAAKESTPHILESYPELAELSPGPLSGKQECVAWLETQIEKVGNCFALAPLPEGDHTRIRPQAEFLMKKSKGKIVPGSSTVRG